MGRGGIQPDAITFYDVPAHERNVIITTDSTRITPWDSRDERVLQFFGITDRCVELYAEEQDAGQGLGGEGQWRIEYYNATGHVYINSTDLGKTVADGGVRHDMSFVVEDKRRAAEKQAELIDLSTEVRWGKLGIDLCRNKLEEYAGAIFIKISNNAAGNIESDGKKDSCGNNGNAGKRADQDGENRKPHTPFYPWTVGGRSKR